MNKAYFSKPSITGTEQEVMLSVLSDKWPSGILDWLKHLSSIGASFEACQLFWKAADLYKQSDCEDYRTMRLLTQIKAYRFWDGIEWSMFVYHWSRDCDLAEGDSVGKIPATLDSFNSWEESIWESAEGPQRYYIIPQSEALAFKPTFRDRAAEMMGY